MDIANPMCQIDGILISPNKQNMAVVLDRSGREVSLGAPHDGSIDASNQCKLFK